MSFVNIQCFFVLFDSFSYFLLLENQRPNGIAREGRVITANAAQSIWKKFFKMKFTRNLIMILQTTIINFLLQFKLKLKFKRNFDSSKI